MKTAFVFLAILATAMASSTRRWGSSQPEPADDPECKKILGKLSGLWSRENKEDSKTTLGKNGYKEMKMKRKQWEKEGCDCESHSAPFHKELVFKRGKADYCKTALCKALQKDVRCEKKEVTAIACKVGQEDTGKHNPKLTEKQYKQECGDGHKCCCPHDKRSFFKRLRDAGLKSLPRKRHGDWSEFCEFYERKGRSEGQFWHVLTKAGATCDAEMGEKMWGELCSNLGNGKKMLSGNVVSASSPSKGHVKKSKLRYVKAPKGQKVAPKAQKGLGGYMLDAALHGAKKIDKWAGEVADSIGPVEIARLEKRRL